MGSVVAIRHDVHVVSNAVASQAPLLTDEMERADDCAVPLTVRTSVHTRNLVPMFVCILEVISFAFVRR